MSGRNRDARFVELLPQRPWVRIPPGRYQEPLTTSTRRRRYAASRYGANTRWPHLNTMILPPTLTDHFDGVRFYNPDIGETPDRRGLWQLLRWRFGGARVPWPKTVRNNPHPLPEAPTNHRAIVTFIGHASFLIQLPGLTIVTDPVFSERASPVSFAGPKRVRPPGIALGDLPKIDLILLSHNHYDHADLASLRALHEAHQPRAVTLVGNVPLLAKAGLTATELDWWDQTDIAGVRITATPARHFSRRGLRDGNRALWGGFMITAGETRVLFAGDSGMGPHWGDIAARLGPPDLALLPIGAYEPRWLMSPVHMNPDEAVQAHRALAARRSIGMHFGTFRLTDEAINAPVERLRQICLDQDVVNFDVLDVGASACLNLAPPVASEKKRVGSGW